jgi:hypothetical protein
MGLNLKPTSGKDFGELVPEGDYFAVCVGVIDLGTHTPIRGFQGAAPTAAHKVYIAWELADYTGNPVVGKDFTASLNEKAKLRAWVKKWRGRDFGEQEEFQLSKLVGQKCQLTISHTRSGERTFANVEELTKLRSTDKVPDATRELITFDLDSGKAVYVPDWICGLRRVRSGPARSRRRATTIGRTRGRKPSWPARRSTTRFLSAYFRSCRGSA